MCKIKDENKKIFFKCNRTNEEGDECEECVEGYEVGDGGNCVNMEQCEEEKDGICVKCKDGDQSLRINFCANEIFGCVQARFRNCLRCENILDFNNCTECKEGFVKAFFGGCMPENT